jgi:aminoglycoside 3-N-acetyltransferase
MPNARPMTTFARLLSKARRVFVQARERVNNSGNPWQDFHSARLKWNRLLELVPDEGPPITPERLASARRRLVRGHLYPKCALQLEIDRWCQTLQSIVSVRNPLTLAPLSPTKLDELRRIIPVSLKTRRMTRSEKPQWLDEALTLFTGKRNLSEILVELAGRGIEVDPVETERVVRKLKNQGLLLFERQLRKSDLAAALWRLGVRKGDVVVAHTSLSGFGYIEGGAETMIDVLLEAIGPNGTLAAPAHSLSWVGRPPYDPATSSVETGIVPRVMLTRPGAVRSKHPTHSVVAIGPAARKLVRGHDCSCAPHGRSGFWGNFVRANGRVVLLCPLTSNTLLHSIDLWSGVPYPSVVAHYLRNGRRIEFIEHGVPWEMTSFSTVYREMFRLGLMCKTRLGKGVVYSHLAADAIRVGMPLMRANPQLATRHRCSCWYCQIVRRALEGRRRESE